MLPHHPIWNKSGLKSEIMKIVNSDLARRLWGICFSRDPPEVGIAWRNGGPPGKFVFCDTANLQVDGWGGGRTNSNSNNNNNLITTI